MCWVGGMWEITVPSSEFCCEPKIALKGKVFKKLNWITYHFEN